MHTNLSVFRSFAPLALLAILPLGLGCSDEATPPGSRDPHVPGTPAAQRVHPTITLQSPQTASFVPLREPVMVTGLVAAGSAPIKRFLINGEEVQLNDEGRFNINLATSPGPNIVGLRAEAEDGGRAIEAATVFVGDTHQAGAAIPGGVVLHASRELIDDGDPDVNDMAGLIGAILVDPAFHNLIIGQRLGQEPFGEFSLNAISMSSAEVDMVPTDELPPPLAGPTDDVAPDSDPCGHVDTPTAGFEVDIYLSNLNLSLTIDSLAAALTGDNATLTANQVHIEAALCPKLLPNGIIDTGIRNPYLEITGDFEIVSDRDALGALSDAEQQAVRQLIEAYGPSLFADISAKTINDLLQGFGLDDTIGEDPPIRARLVPDDLRITLEGMVLSFASAFSAPIGLARVPMNAGSLRTDDPPAPALDWSDPLAVVVSDDAVNQLLFAYWWGGKVAGLDLSPYLAEEALDALPDVFKPLDEVKLSSMLPPTLVVPAPESNFIYDLAQGDLGFTIANNGVNQFESTLHLKAGVYVAVRPPDILQIQLDNSASTLTVEATLNRLPPALEATDVAALLRLMAPSMIGAAASTLEGFPLPNISLDDIDELSALSGRQIGLAQTQARRIGEGSGYLVIGGEVTLAATPTEPEASEEGPEE